jgi:hypothetical protein
MLWYVVSSSSKQVVYNNELRLRMRGFSQALRYRTRLPPVCAPIGTSNAARTAATATAVNCSRSSCSNSSSTVRAAAKPYVRYKRGGQLKSNPLRQVAVAGAGHVAQTFSLCATWQCDVSDSLFSNGSKSR